MNRRLVVRIVTALLAVAMLAVPASALAGKNGGGKNKNKALVVCKHGCKYRTIQKAVDKAGKTKKKNDMIKVKPGKYVEGVQALGKTYSGLTIMGTNKNARKTILEGKNAQLPGGVGIANNGIEIADAKNVTVKNMWVRNFATNGVFWHDTNTDDNKATCQNAVAKNVDVSFNRSYGLFMFGCEGGSFNKSEGWGHGDSAYYVGATPFQDDPQKTVLKNLDSYENVLGYSGTNSKYVVIKNNNFYNNGVGVVPNTLDSEPYEPASNGVIENNNIFWNNFNYFLPNSRVKTVSNGLGTVEGIGTIQYPTGAGVVLLGSTGWIVRNNNIFGNFKWGAAVVADPFNEGDNAIPNGNQFIDNQMGRNGTDTNAVDVFNQGAGSGQCFQGNSSSTFDSSGNPASDALLYPSCPAPTGTGNCWMGNNSSTFDHSASMLDLQLYPSCPAPAGTGGNGSSIGDQEQFGELAGYVTTNPPENQECSWTRHDHPAFEDFKPLTVTPGPTC
jgi:hypothetical protein